MRRKTKDPVTEVLPQVANLVERLRSRLISGVTLTAAPEYEFFSKWGGLDLRGAETVHYRQCRDALIDIHGKNTERRTLSRRAVEVLLRDTLLRTLRPGALGYNDPRPKFERRLKTELRKLRKGLERPLRTWRVVFRVTGLGDGVLPLQFGSIRFTRGSEHNARRVAAAAVRPGPPRTVLKPKNVPFIAKDRVEIVESFSDEAMAMLVVDAVDGPSAKQLALVEVRRNLDVLNFFAPFFEHPVGPHVAYVAPASRGDDLNYLVYDPQSWWITVDKDTPDRWSLQKLRPKSRRSKQIGLDRVEDLLARKDPTDLEERLVTAVGWAGRARAERGMEQAFLLYTIALEALLTKPSARSGVTERLKLRVAHVVHRKPASRRILVDTMGRLYDMRSAIVHTGKAAALHEGDVRLIERVVDLTIITMLTREPFRSMRRASEFEDWFDRRLLGERR